jgi:hypothetical protein
MFISRAVHLQHPGSAVGRHAGNPEYFISHTMLGGVPYCWKDEDNAEVPLNELAGTLTGDGTSLAFHADAVGNADTASLAKVVHHRQLLRYAWGRHRQQRRCDDRHLSGGHGSFGELILG